MTVILLIVKSYFSFFGSKTSVLVVELQIISGIENLKKSLEFVH